MSNALCRYLGAFGRTLAVATVECHRRRAQRVHMAQLWTRSSSFPVHQPVATAKRVLGTGFFRVFTEVGIWFPQKYGEKLEELINNMYVYIYIYIIYIYMQNK